MPRPHTTMRKVRDVLRLSWGEQLSLRQVARSLSMPHTSVAVFLRRAKDAGLTWPLPEDLDDDALEARLFDAAAPSPSHAAPDFATVKRELAVKGVTLQLLWLEYKELHLDGYGYSQFCHLYRTWRRHQSVVMRHDHKASEKLFVDFPGMTIPIYDERDLTVSFRAELFVAVLGASSYLFVEALRSQQLEHWMTAHVHAFEFFGGCPEVVVPEYVPRNIFALMCPVALCGAFGVELRNCGGGRTGDGDRGNITLRARRAN